MTREEINQRLEEIDDRKFTIKMIDRWDSECYKIYDELTAEEKRLYELLKELN